MNRTALDHHATDWFAAGFRLRVKDVDAGVTLTDRNGSQFYVLDRTTDANGNHVLTTRHNGVERAQSFGPFDTLDAFFVLA